MDPVNKARFPLSQKAIQKYCGDDACGRTLLKTDDCRQVGLTVDQDLIALRVKLKPLHAYEFLLAQRRENQPAGNAEEWCVAKSEFRLERTAGNRLCLSHSLSGSHFELYVNVIGLFKVADDGLTEESMRIAQDSQHAGSRINDLLQISLNLVERPLIACSISQQLIGSF